MGYSYISMELSFISFIKKNKVGNYITIPHPTNKLLHNDQIVQVTIKDVDKSKKKK